MVGDRSGDVPAEASASFSGSFLDILSCGLQGISLTLGKPRDSRNQPLR
jgi:hypothetical protein